VKQVKTVKRAVISAAVAAALGFGFIGSAGATGIPVVDAAGLTQMLVEYGNMTEQLATLKSQYDTAIQQYETAVSQLKSLEQQATTMKNMYTDMSGITNGAQLFQNVVGRLHSAMPDALTDVESVTGPVAALAGQIRAAKQEFTSDAVFPLAGSDKRKAQYEKKGTYLFTYAAQAKIVFDAFAQRRTDLASLNTAGASATTQKEALDLIAKGVAEQTLLLNDIGQLLALDLKVRLDKETLDYNEDALKRAPGQAAGSVQY